MTGPGRITALLNAASEEEARADLVRCCGSRRWAEAMLRRRPFPADAELFRAAEEVWWSLEPEDWKEAFAAHPRIGQRLDEETDATAWSREEQAGVASAGETTSRALAVGNRAYEARFGHVFLICATGKTAEEMLRALEERLRNDPETELRVAAAEQAEITRLRLEKLAE
ncbi:MAG: 2-oxo-4-hydroxy-4-carboxy-5-ureidoimidazoline decarboxylase [Gemmatimonadota bacterium]